MSSDKNGKETLNDDRIAVNSQEQLLLIIINNIFQALTFFLEIVFLVKRWFGIIEKHLYEDGGFRRSSALCMFLELSVLS